MTQTKIGVLGAAGRMGKTLIQAVKEQRQILTVATVREGSSLVGADAGELAGVGSNLVNISSDLASVIDDCEVLIDFTTPTATMLNLKLCAQKNIPIVIGTTGLSAEQQAEIKAYAKQIPIVYAANYSVGVNISLKVLQLAAKAFGETVDIEIIEAHHKHKVDAPSGTALMMGRAITEALEQNLDEVAVYARQGHTGVREKGTIGFQTIRGGDIVGDHNVMFIGEGERLEVRHVATSRMNFASGAVRASIWVAHQPAGLYDMQDVLGLKD